MCAFVHERERTREKQRVENIDEFTNVPHLQYAAKVVENKKVDDSSLEARDTATQSESAKTHGENKKVNIPPAGRPATPHTT